MSRTSNDARIDLHNQLKDILITRYLSGLINNGQNFIKWKSYFTKHCPLPVFQRTDIRRDFAYLEKKNFISVGKYSFLYDVFAKIDSHAIDVIEEIAAEIHSIPTTSVTGRRKLGKVEVWKENLTHETPDVEDKLCHTIQGAIHHIEAAADPTGECQKVIETLEQKLAVILANTTKHPEIYTQSIHAIFDDRNVSHCNLRTVKYIFKFLRKLKNYHINITALKKKHITLLIEFNTDEDFHRLFEDFEMGFLKKDISDFFSLFYMEFGLNVKDGDVHVQLQDISELELATAQKIDLVWSVETDEIQGICHISPGQNGDLWISDNRSTMVLTDKNGEIKSQLDVECGGWGIHTSNDKSDLLFIDKKEDHLIKSFTPGNTIEHVLSLRHWSARCLYSSRLSGNILVGMVCLGDAKIKRYRKDGKKLQQIQYDRDHQPLFEIPLYITENINGDVCVSDWGKGVVVVDKSGSFRFCYKISTPCGICSDSLGRIYVSNNTSMIHVIGLNGNRLFLLETKTERITAIHFEEKSQNLTLPSRGDVIAEESKSMTSSFSDGVIVIYVGNDESRRLDVYEYTDVLGDEI